MDTRWKKLTDEWPNEFTIVLFYHPTHGIGEGFIGFDKYSNKAYYWVKRNPEELSPLNNKDIQIMSSPPTHWMPWSYPEPPAAALLAARKEGQHD